MDSIGLVRISVKDFKKIKNLLKIFEPDEDGKEVIKLQVKNGKLEIEYEDGE